MIICIGPPGAKPITYLKPTIVGSASVAATSVTIPAHQVGDLIIVHTWRTSTSLPSKPAASGNTPAWVDINASTGANSCSSRIAYFVATATTTTTGTWTNAVDITVVVIRNARITGTGAIGGHAESGGTTTTVSPYPAIAPAVTMNSFDGTSLLLHFYCASTVGAAADGWSAAPSGFTRVKAVGGSNGAGACVNTKDDTTSDGSSSQGTGWSLSQGYRGAAVEVISVSSKSPIVSAGKIVTLPGSSTSGTTWNHVFGPTDTAILVPVAVYMANATRSAYTRSCSVGGVPLTLAGIVSVNNSDGYGWQEFWTASGSDISAFAGTTKTVAFNEYYTADPTVYAPTIACDSLSFPYCSGFGTAVTAYGNSATASVTVPSDSTHQVVSAAMANTFDFSAFSKRMLYHPAVIGGMDFFEVQTGQGSASTVQTATLSNSGQWCTVGIDVIPIS